MGWDSANKIKCGSCKKHKSEELFSQSSIKKYKESRNLNQRNSNVPIKSINCIACNDPGRHELHCNGCNKTLPLEKFNKTQRRKGDDALCQDCSQDYIDIEPDHENQVQEEEIIEEIKKSEISGYSYHSSRMSSAQRSRLQSSNSRYETDTNPGSDFFIDGNDAISLTGTEVTDYSSTASRPKTGTAWDAFAGDNRPTTSSKSGNAGFAKQGAVKRDKYEKASAQVERDQRRIRDQDEIVRDESDDSDDDDDPY